MSTPLVSNNNEVTTWTPEQVADWATKNGYQSISHELQAQKVNGRALLKLTRDDMKDEPFKLLIGDALNFVSDVETLHVPPAAQAPLAGPGTEWKCGYNRGWQRDLCRECIEPNPGPSWEDVKDALNKKLGAGAESYKEQITKLQDTLNKKYDNAPDEVDIHQFMITPDFQSIFGDRTNKIRKFIYEIIPLVFPAGPGTAQVPPAGPGTDHAVHNRLGWSRDLTRECVEPNPGPAMEKVFKSLRQELGSKLSDFADGITQLELEIQAQHGNDLVMHQDVHLYITQNQQQISSIFGEKKAAQVVQLLGEVLHSIAPPLSFFGSGTGSNTAQVPPPGPSTGPRSYTEEDIGLWIKTQHIDDCHLKDNFLIPHMMAAFRVAWKPIPLDKTVHEIVTACAERKQRRGNKPYDKLNNPLMALQAAPGTGKSTCLDLAGVLIGTSQLKEVIDKQNPTSQHLEMVDILSKSVPIMVTYNSHTPFNSVIEGNNSEHGLALRVLFSFFYTQSSKFYNFTKAFGSGLINLETALSIVMTSLPETHTGIFLGVDELIKAGGFGVGKDARVADVLGCLGNALNVLCDFNALVTTLDQGPVLMEKTRSRRPISWIRLCKPSLSKVLTLFPEEFKTNLKLRRCVSDCNSHFRSLETLCLEWQKDHGLGITFQYADLMRRVAEGFNYPNTNLWSELVYAALEGALVNLNTMIGPKTFKEHIMDGVFLNALFGEQESAVPLLSPLVLHRWALHRAQGFDGPKAQAVARCIINMMRLLPNFNWQQYEEFHAEWEILKRVLLDGKTVGVSEFYTPVPDGLEQSVVNSIPPNLTFLVQQKKTGVVKLPHHYKQCTKITSTSAMYLPAPNNPGFDIISLERDEVAICVECRFSMPTSKTQLSPSEVQQKREFTLQEVTNFSRENIILVVCAFRKLDSDWRKEQPTTQKNKRLRNEEGGEDNEDNEDNEDMEMMEDTKSEEDSDSDYEGAKVDLGRIVQKPPPNTLVLGRAALRKMYTDSLISLPIFILENVVE